MCNTLIIFDSVLTVPSSFLRLTQSCLKDEEKKKSKKKIKREDIRELGLLQWPSPPSVWMLNQMSRVTHVSLRTLKGLKRALKGPCGLWTILKELLRSGSGQ